VQACVACHLQNHHHPNKSGSSTVAQVKAAIFLPKQNRVSFAARHFLFWQILQGSIEAHGQHADAAD